MAFREHLPEMNEQATANVIWSLARLKVRTYGHSFKPTVLCPVPVLPQYIFTLCDLPSP